LKAIIDEDTAEACDDEGERRIIGLKGQGGLSSVERANTMNR
jgi:hypothetical protein